MSSFTHLHEYMTLNSFAALDELVTTNEVTTRVPLRPVEVKKQVRRDVHYESFKDSNIMIAIQNDPKFLHFILSIKHIKTSVYMYAEGINYLVFIITMNERYPVCVVKFPIEYPTIIQHNISDVFFSFPMSVVASYISKNDKMSNQYSLIIKNVDSKVVLEYKSVLDNVTNQSDLLVRVPKQETLDIVYYDKIKSLDMFVNELVGIKNANHFETINSMRVLMISECRDFNQICKDKNIDYAIQTLDVSNDTVVLTINLNVNKTSIQLADKPTSVFWSSALIPTALSMYPYSSIFKSVDRIKSKSDNCYYILCNYKSFEHNDTYMLVKVITRIDLKKIIIDEGTTFNQLFDSGFLMYELYFCYGNKVSMNNSYEYLYEDY